MHQEQRRSPCGAPLACRLTAERRTIGFRQRERLELPRCAGLPVPPPRWHRQDQRGTPTPDAPDSSLCVRDYDSRSFSNPKIKPVSDRTRRVARSKPSMNDSSLTESCQIVSVWPGPPKMTSWCATKPGSRTLWIGIPSPRAPRAPCSVCSSLTARRSEEHTSELQ